MNKLLKILVIDDEPDMLRSSCKILNSAEYITYPLNDSSQIESHLNENSYDLILCDLLMPKLDGIQIINFVKNNYPNLPIIIFSAYGTVDRAVNCMKAGAFDFIEKPFEAEHLLLVVERALKYSKLFEERNRLLKELKNQSRFDKIVGKSKEMMNIFSMIDTLSHSLTNVLITGESGTGKELIARSIHSNSPRNRNPFIPINCGALPDSLFEAEIFGYEKGAFTGADSRKIGLMETANGGTFFLDEIAELSPTSQTKLLRVLQEKKLRRLGGNQLIDLDIRVISATNRSIEVIMKNNLMREDLFYRLNVINIHLPPLRNRQDDIQSLAEYFLNINKEKSQKDLKGFDSEVIQIFENYNWPGNIRELENIVERAAALTKNDIITAEDLPKHLVGNKKNFKEFNQISIKEARRKAIEETDKEYLTFLLQKFEGNISLIAEATEMTKRNIYMLLNKYDMSPDKWR